MSVALVKSSSVVGGMTLISRFLGFARDMLLAILFGASASMDAFLVAFKIPNFMRRLFAEGAFAQSFVPVLAATKQEASHEEVRQLVAEVSGTLAGVLSVLTIIGVVAAPALIFLFAPGFVDEASKFELAGSMLRITFPYLFFIALTALAASVLNTYGQFALPAVAPALLNVSLIACAVWLAPHLERPIMALAIGVFIAGVAQLLVLLPAVARLGLLPRPRWAWASERVRRIMRLMLPIIFGSSVAQIALLLDTILASLLISGSVSWLYYADRLMEFPLGIFSIAIATVILPALSRNHAANDAQAFSRTLDWALQLILLVCLPSAVGLFLLAGPVLTTLFQYAAFTPHDVVMSGYSLMAYAFGLLGFSLVKIAAPAYFARQDTRTPVVIGIKALLIGMSFNLIGVLVALHLQWKAPHLVLAIGTSLGAFVNAGLLLRGLKRSGVYRSECSWGRVCGQYLIASMLMAAVLWGLNPTQGWWFEAGALERGVRLLGIILAGVGTYFFALLALGLRPKHLSGVQ
ncbi:MAG: murein biosynthesis integral membrane protein MurJ [Oceanococcus sp.]